jgi:ribosomal protein S18 acetylase RimI-like enzyme
MLGPQDVGYRVVVRRIVGIRDNRPLFTDVLGELVEYGVTGLTVDTRRGPERVPHDAIQAAKRVPRSQREVTELERVANAVWPAPTQERLGDWTLRAADGWTGRGNSALPLGNPGLDREAAIDVVVDWYAARGLPARINVPLPPGTALDAALTARGWTRSVPTLVLTARLPAVLAATEDRPDLPPVRLDPAPDDAWLAVVAARKGRLPAAALHILTGAPAVVFASVEGDRAVARGAVAGGFLHLGLLEVADGARRRGLARHVTRALADWGGKNGAGTAFLQVESTNAAALALYGRLGFTVHHEYVTRTIGPAF